MSDFIDGTYKRVEILIAYKGMNIRSFEEKIKVSNNSIGTAIRRKASFKSNVLNKILNSFPDINPTWLLTGKGNMFINESTSLLSEEPKISYENTAIKTSLINLLVNDKEIKTVLEEQIQNIIKK